jgi:hypothetical protein
VLAGPVTGATLPSDHYQFLHPPLVTQVAAAIAAAAAPLPEVAHVP